MSLNMEGAMPSPQQPHHELAEPLRYRPLRIPDPGPPWWFDVLAKEQQVEVIVSQLQLEKELMAAEIKAIDRQIAIVSRKG
jgi:hypothetical protein